MSFVGRFVLFRRLFCTECILEYICVSFVGRFVLFRRLFCTECILEYILCVLCWEVCPLSEVILYRMYTRVHFVCPLLGGFRRFTILAVKYLFLCTACPWN